MTVMELKKAYAELPEKEQLLFASLLAAEQMAKDPEFGARLEARHQAMDAGKKWSHADVLELHDQLEKQGL